MSIERDVRLALREALGLRERGELVAIVGGGGKSTLLFALGREPGRWVLTTTTRIFAAQIASAAAHCEASDLARHLEAGVRGLLVIGEVQGDKAFGVEADLPARILSHSAVDCVAVEADGSRMRPTKAPADHEPVIPKETTLVVVVAGIDALDGPVRETAHRPERVEDLTGVKPDEALRPEDLGVLLRHARGGRKGVPERARVAVLLNKVESERERELARRVAQEALTDEGIERVLIGSLRDEAGSWETYCHAPASSD